MRCFCATLGLILLGLLVHFAAVSTDELTAKHNGKALWMAAWCGLLGFVVFRSIRLAVVGLP